MLLHREMPYVVRGWIQVVMPRAGMLVGRVVGAMTGPPKPRIVILEGMNLKFQMSDLAEVVVIVQLPLPHPIILGLSQ